MGGTLAVGGAGIRRHEVRRCDAFFGVPRTNESSAAANRIDAGLSGARRGPAITGAHVAAFVGGAAVWVPGVTAGAWNGVAAVDRRVRGTRRHR